MELVVGKISQRGRGAQTIVGFQSRGHAIRRDGFACVNLHQRNSLFVQTLDTCLLVIVSDAVNPAFICRYQSRFKAGPWFTAPSSLALQCERSSLGD